MKVRLTPMGLALGLAAEAGLLNEPPTNEEMAKFRVFWEQVEKHAIPLYLKRIKEAEACEAPAT